MLFLLKLSPINVSIQMWTVQKLLFCFGFAQWWLSGCLFLSVFTNWDSPGGKNCLFSASMDSWIFTLSYRLISNIAIIYFVSPITSALATRSSFFRFSSCDNPSSFSEALKLYKVLGSAVPRTISHS